MPIFPLEIRNKKKKIKKGDQSIGRSVGRLEKSIASNVNIIACANFCQEIHARRGGICNFIAWMKLVPNLSNVEIGENNYWLAI